MSCAADTEKTPLRKKGGCDQTPKVDGILNESSNVLLLFRLEDFQKRSNVNFWLALLSLVCCGVNMMLLYLNYALNHDEEPPNVPERTFHVIEFWTTFLYALIEAYALVTSPKALQTICYRETFLKVLFFFNVVAALVPALLITLDTEYFEHVSHELEYLNEFSMSLVSLILLVSLLKKDGSYSGDATSLTLVILSIVVAMVTFTIYNLGPEEVAHYFEFYFNIFSCLITFWFCMDNRFVAEMEIGQILFGIHADCNLCKSNVVSLQNNTTVQWTRLYGSMSTITQQQREGVLAASLLDSLGERHVSV